MEKRGFTLIELLAVIIILAIIALIATPIILNVIEDARKSAGLSESKMIMSGINNYCATSAMKAQLDESTDICNDDDGVTIDDVSKMVSLGNAEVLSVNYNGNKITELVIKSNSYTYKLCSNGTFVMENEECPRDPNSLITKLLNQYSEGASSGLVQDETNSNIYYYKGNNDEVANNYLWYGGHHWRVIEIDTDANTLLLISQQPLTAISPASEVWDTEEAYKRSYINTWLNGYFYNSLDSDIQNNILDNTFNIGERTAVDEITIAQKVGLLDDNQYKRAGGRNSYLHIQDNYWLGGPFDVVYNDDSVILDDPQGVRPVIKISDITITEGDGTLTSNYKTADKSTDTNEVQVGEYINVPYSGSDKACGDDNKCTFRVVSKDNDSIKVVLNGLLPSESEYGSSTTITTKHTIYTPLNAFVEGISDTYRYTGNKTFYIGNYSGAANYTDVQDETLEASVGLPTVGEMFSGNDIDLGTSSTKIFVDVSTIENPMVDNYYCTMNRYSSSEVRTIDYNGTGRGRSLKYNYSPATEFGVRPVIFLKNNLNFISGNGTTQSPYELQ